MSLRKIHNYVSTIYHFIFSDPQLFNLIDKIDKLSTDDLSKIISYNIINSYNYDNVLTEINSIENKNNMIFCNVIVDIIKKLPFENNKLILSNEILSHEILSCYLEFIKNIYKYYIIGFFFDSYLDKYNKIIDKIKTINDEKKKNDVYILLLKDFLLELCTTFIYNLVAIFKTKFNINIDIGNKSYNIFQEITNKIDISEQIYKTHYNSIEELLNN